MIKAVFKCNPQGNISSFKITGHAQSGPYGQDIVCSAVSAVSIGTINSLQDVAGVQPQVQMNNEMGGYLECQVNYADIKEHDQVVAAVTLMDSCYQISTSIAANYSDFIQITLDKSA
ncbi:ribosomal-processing cysteine protease Prp [Bombilactobacillus bombi]|uniref:Ribosomal processing cysteine protease Prp n=1 Tax=Bombilactobacillus bombi TaxID=1303590 RepID=A0A347SQL7_9LACO|nr:ribosomal-processing cysteine protease Prp [Bombilactobacillus bombi]AXX64326.1 ribosomal-processing cysteine protease Prp [Bombilactobacillus bombi]RHW48341.1 ribosomal-processing cysteine protease Prp [Bombilactobacillus bombi]